LTADWRRNIGYVSQFPYIYHGTLAENIAFGEQKNDIDRNMVLKVCEMASIDFMEHLQDGIDTVIGERGIRLSTVEDCDKIIWLENGIVVAIGPAKAEKD
jgi:ATP-binding cassette, subfamily B, bacterial PglK